MIPVTPSPSTAQLVDALDTLRRVLDVVNAPAIERIAARTASAVAAFPAFEAVVVRAATTQDPATPDEAHAGRRAFPDDVLESVAWPALEDRDTRFHVPDMRTRDDGWHGSLAGASVTVGGEVVGAIVVWCRRPHAYHPWHENLLAMVAGMLGMALRIDAATGTPPYKSPVTGRDPLTGLYDRPGFERELGRLYSHAGPAQRGLYLLFIDVDRFRLVRESGDRLGPGRLLRTLGSLLRRHTASEPLLGRVGPDQFAVVIARSFLTTAMETAFELVQLVDGLRLTVDNRLLEVSISVGLVGFDQGEPGQLLRLAEHACHAAKRQGGGAVEVYDDGMRKGRHPGQDGRLLNRLATALKKDRLELFGQVIVPGNRTADGEAAGPAMYELLLRMRDDAGEPVAAGRLVEVAERYGLSVKLDRWVIRTAFRAIAASRLARVPGCRFLLNLSRQSLDDARLMPFIVEQFRITGLSPSRICFEVTETAAISDLAAARRFVDGLRVLGCEFALDDFGSGNSSFLCLRELAGDYLKIDGELVRAVADDPVSLSLVRTIEGVGRLMGRRTIAEHVEGPRILDAVREIGCDFVQGNWVGTPLPLATILAEAD